MLVVGSGSGEPPEISNPKTCSGCGKVKGLDEFKLKRGNRPTNTCSICRGVVSSTRKRTTTQALLSSPIREQRAPSFMQPTYASRTKQFSTATAREGAPQPILPRGINS